MRDEESQRFISRKEFTEIFRQLFPNDALSRRNLREGIALGKAIARDSVIEVKQKINNEDLR